MIATPLRGRRVRRRHRRFRCRRGSASRPASRRLAGGRLARGLLARGRLTRGRLARGLLARGRLARGRLARGRLARGRLARGLLASGRFARGCLAPGRRCHLSLLSGCRKQRRRNLRLPFTVPDTHGADLVPQHQLKTFFGNRRLIALLIRRENCISSNRVMNAASLRQKSDDVKQRNVDVVATPIAALDPAVAARRAQLRYVHDAMPGITRRQARNGFDYRLPDGSLVRDIATLKRIRKLAIPPAWTDVWICRDPNGHLQATGRDQRGRKQYRYDPRWREVRDEAKYGKLLIFARVLPLIRARVEEDLKRPGLPRERVLAAVVRLMELTLFRVGNAEYARNNKSFGLTTLRDRHARVDGSHIHLSFRGKSGNRYESDINDRRLARIVKGCRDLPGYELFQYLDEDGNRRSVGSADVNEYLREITGEEVTAKDFRTWAATHLAAEALRECERRDTV